jgi:hypothetical protein
VRLDRDNGEDFEPIRSVAQVSLDSIILDYTKNALVCSAAGRRLFGCFFVSVELSTLEWQKSTDDAYLKRCGSIIQDYFCSIRHLDSKNCRVSGIPDHHTDGGVMLSRCGVRHHDPDRNVDARTSTLLVAS